MHSDELIFAYSEFMRLIQMMLACLFNTLNQLSELVQKPHNTDDSIDSNDSYSMFGLNSVIYIAPVFMLIGSNDSYWKCWLVPATRNTPWLLIHFRLRWLRKLIRIKSHEVCWFIPVSHYWNQCLISLNVSQNVST